MLVFTIDDFLQIGFLQIIYVLLLYYITNSAYIKTPKSTFFWVLLVVNAIYICTISATIYAIFKYVPNRNSEGYGWMLYFLATLGPGVLILFTYAMYAVAVNLMKYIKVNRSTTSL